jgi:hypothetical protein
MESQRDKSADLFALTARSRNCRSRSRAPVNPARLLQIRKQQTAEGASSRTASSIRRFLSGAVFAFPIQKSEGTQVWRGAADGGRSEPFELTFQKHQVQPIEQPSAENLGGEAA